MAKGMTHKRFRALAPADFNNSAVLDDIATALQQYEKLVVELDKSLGQFLVQQITDDNLCRATGVALKSIEWHPDAAVRIGAQARELMVARLSRIGQ